MEPYIETKWIYFSMFSFTGKTFVYNIYSKEGKFLLGTIKWYPSWRKYSFLPEGNTVFETQCLKDITGFLDKLMLERKQNKQPSTEVRDTTKE